MKNTTTKMAAAAFLFGESQKGNLLYLFLGIGFLAYGVWYMIKDRKKSKEQREYEQKQLSKRFLDNINRNREMTMGGGETDSRLEKDTKKNNKKQEKNNK